MKYTIKEVYPGQIKIEFDDESTAIVPVGPDFTLEDIDDAVSYYDRDFLPDPETLINKNVSIDQKRESKRKPPKEPDIFNSRPENFIPAVRTPVLSFGRAHAADCIVLAEYYAERGDMRLKEGLKYQAEKFINSPGFDLEEMILELCYDPDEIFDLAEKELGDEENV